MNLTNIPSKQTSTANSNHKPFFVSNLQSKHNNSSSKDIFSIEKVNLTGI